MNPISFQDYLRVKVSVDDRSLNLRLWLRLRDELALLQAETEINVLELGCGTGSMLTRMEAGGLLTQCRYTAIDADPANIDQLIEYWSDRQWAPRGVFPTFHTADVFDFLRQASGDNYHLVIAHAFLDLVHVPSLLSLLKERTAPSGWWYFTINFDGLTIVEPPIDPHFDDLVLECYHQSMDDRTVPGGLSAGSRAGRRLFSWLEQAGAQVVSAGPSDWVVHPVNGSYLADEALFLHYLIDTIAGALLDNPDIDTTQFANWIAARHCQIDAGVMILIVHQLDFLAKLT